VVPSVPDSADPLAKPWTTAATSLDGRAHTRQITEGQSHKDIRTCFLYAFYSRASSGWTSSVQYRVWRTADRVVVVESQCYVNNPNASALNVQPAEARQRASVIRPNRSFQPRQSGIDVGEDCKLQYSPASTRIRALTSPTVCWHGGEMRAKTSVLTLTLCFLAAGVCFASDAQMGTWKLNEAKSKLAAAMPKNSTIVFEASGDSVKVTIDGTDSAGKPTHNEWTGKFDGKDYPVTGDPNSDARSYKQLDDHTLEFTIKKGEKVTITGPSCGVGGWEDPHGHSEWNRSAGQEVQKHLCVRQAVAECLLREMLTTVVPFRSFSKGRAFVDG
jgi:hypothetical protein